MINVLVSDLYREVLRTEILVWVFYSGGIHVYKTVGRIMQVLVCFKGIPIMHWQQFTCNKNKLEIRSLMDVIPSDLPF